MNDPLVQLLTSKNIEDRKRGVTLAAKSVDRRFLPALAKLYQTDPDEGVRELAKKAGSYIHKHAPTPEAMTTPPKAAQPAPQPKPAAAPAAKPKANVPAPAMPDLNELLRAEVASPNATKDIPELGELIRGEVKPPSRPAAYNPSQAEIHYNLAFEMHLRNDNARAVMELGTAFYMNPDLEQDIAAVNLAAELTGLPPQQAPKHIANPQNWRTLANQHGGFGKSPIKQDRSFLLWAAIAILGLIAVAVVFAFLRSPIFNQAVQQLADQALGGITGDPTLVAPTLTP
jgi:hypothetical protein